MSAPAPARRPAFEAGAAIAAQLADDLASMLRHRIEEALSGCEGSAEGSADAAGVAYREWKGTRVEGLAGDFTTRAFAAGEPAALASAGNGAVPLVRWAVEDDDGGGSCPDCDDNSLAGPQYRVTRSRPDTRSPRCTRAAGASSCPFGPRLSVRANFGGFAGPVTPGSALPVVGFGAVVFLIIAVTSSKGSPLLHELPLYLLGQIHSCMAAYDRDQSTSWPLSSSSCSSSPAGSASGWWTASPRGTSGLARARNRPPPPTDRERSHLCPPHSRIRDPRVDRGCVDRRPVAALAHLPQWQVLRGVRPSVPQDGRFLRVPPTFPVLPRGLGPRRPPADPHHDEPQPLPERRHQVPGPLPPRRTGWAIARTCR